MSESALSLGSQLAQLLALEFEALKSQQLDQFEALQPGKNDLLTALASACPSAEDLQNLPEWEELRELLIDCRDLHRRNAVLIERKLDAIRGTLHSLRTGESGSPVEVYDRLGQVARFSKGRGYQEV
ncbi:MAG: flagellar protein FlgN [Betaproteobacteria bacterium]|nr:flagellar protein FlgN [Burkholderiales bacterium]NBX14268.1 flagellar protein FlgN [Betaproteobacteria bacterium]NBX90935.1 flagellar protein FlgN [Betaproteobacteria bacterium]